jgi:hypothetical protein
MNSESFTCLYCHPDTTRQPPTLQILLSEVEVQQLAVKVSRILPHIPRQALSQRRQTWRKRQEGEAKGQRSMGTAERIWSQQD